MPKRRVFRVPKHLQPLLNAALLLAIIIGVAFALVPKSSGPHSIIGNDISYPQCGKHLPNGQAFAVIGVNGGTSSKPNPCLAAQLDWAKKSSGIVKDQPKVQLYLNTGNPADIHLAEWPHNNRDYTGHTTQNPYGSCRHEESTACAWQYGWNQTLKSVYGYFLPIAHHGHISTKINAYIWWLDVETRNSWQFDTPAQQAHNAASLEGTAAFLEANHAEVGIYSTSYQWHKIAGDISPKSNLQRLKNWRGGALDTTDARIKCAGASVSPSGKIVLVQYVSGEFDYNYACSSAGK